MREPEFSMQVVARNHENFNVLKLRIVLVAIEHKVIREVKAVHASLRIIFD